jgi:hypothetical protein
MKSTKQMSGVMVTKEKQTVQNGKQITALIHLLTLPSCTKPYLSTLPSSNFLKRSIAL